LGKSNDLLGIVLEDILIYIKDNIMDLDVNDFLDAEPLASCNSACTQCNATCQQCVSTCTKCVSGGS
jgi:hypothetical protein